VEIKIKWIKRKQMTHENTYRDDTNSPLFCLSVIYIQKSLKRWKKDFFAVTEKISVEI
jgi:hypothetical protein